MSAATAGLRGVLLILGAIACARGPGGPDGPGGPGESGGSPWFVEQAAARGLVFRHVSGHDGSRYYMPEIMGGGAALFDADDDGDLDAYLVQSGSIVGASAETNRFFRNAGGTFTDETEASGTGDPGYGMGVAAGDADEDGRVDLYVTNVGPNALFVNGGGARFADRTAAAGVGDPSWGTSAGFFDADRDGDLDLFVANYLDWRPEGELPCRNNASRPDYCSPKTYEQPARSVFYRNDGTGGFVDDSAPSGIADVARTSLGVAFLDFDDDGWLDVFVANDGMDDVLWHNLGDGRFADEAWVRGCAVDEDGTRKAGMGIACADLDGDLDLDLLVCNLSRETDSLYLYEDGHFLDRTARVGLGSVSRPFTRFGVGVIDFDHDGRLDLFQADGRVSKQSKPLADDPYAEPNLLFAGLDGPRFAEVAPRGGVEPELVATSRAAAFGDVDGDGGVDVLVVNRDAPAHLLVDAVAARGAWIRFRVLERSGRDALGATLVVRVGEAAVRRDVTACSSYLASSDPRVHLGLGDAMGVGDVVVRWVDGASERFAGPFAARREHRLARGLGTPER